MDLTAQLIVADSGVRITADSPESDELFAIFQSTSIFCTLERKGAGGPDIIHFYSPYDVGRIVDLFARWQEHKGLSAS